MLNKWNNSVICYKRYCMSMYSSTAVCRQLKIWETLLRGSYFSSSMFDYNIDGYGYLILVWVSHELPEWLNEHLCSNRYGQLFPHAWFEERFTRTVLFNPESGSTFRCFSLVAWHVSWARSWLLYFDRWNLIFVVTNGPEGGLGWDVY